MTITSVSLTQEGTGLTAAGKEGEFVKRTYNAHYRVITDDPTTSPAVVEDFFRNHPSYNGSPLPWFGRSWKWTSTTSGSDSDPSSICKKIDVGHIPGSAGIFKVEATFEPIDGEDNKEKPDNDKGDNTDDPLNWREQVSVNYTQITVPVWFATFRGFSTGFGGNTDMAGTNLMQIGRSYVPMNSALVPYDPLPEMELDIKVIRFTRNIAEFDSNNYDPWIGTVNSDAVVINKPNLKFKVQFGPLVARMKSISATSDFQNGVSFFRREVEIWVNPNGWRGRLLDQGFASRLSNTDDGFVSPGDLENQPWLVEQRLMKDQDDYPMTSPMPLDGFGRVLRTDQANNQVWTNWSWYDEKAWQPVAAQF